MYEVMRCSMLLNVRIAQKWQNCYRSRRLHTVVKSSLSVNSYFAILNRTFSIKIARSALLFVCLTRLKSFSVHSFHPAVSIDTSSRRWLSNTESPTIINQSALAMNPLLKPYTTKHAIPPFADIDSSHYKGAFEVAFVEHEAELKSIVDNKEPPSFDNTLLAFDRAGSLLTKIGKVYYNLCSSMCPPGERRKLSHKYYWMIIAIFFHLMSWLELQLVQSEMATVLAAEECKTYMFPGTRFFLTAAAVMNMWTYLWYPPIFLVDADSKTYS